MSKDNNKYAISNGMIYGGVIGLAIGAITSLGWHNDNFIYIYLAPIYIYSYIFHGMGNENIVICVYYFLLSLCIGYLYSANLPKKKKLPGIMVIILLHLGLTIFGGKAISKDLKEFLNNMPAEMIVGAIGDKNNQ